MAIKAAKESFEKDDIIEILKRNVALYKDEREFVEYIVNLAMYLIDQYHVKKRDEDDDLEEVVFDFPMPPAAIPAAPIKAPAPVRLDAGESSSSSLLPPTAEERMKRQTAPRTYQAFTSSGPQAPDDSDFKMPPRPGTHRTAASYTPAHRGEDEKMDLEVEATPLMTPLGDALRDPKRGKKPEGEEGPSYEKGKQQDEPPKVDPRNAGRTRVYRVVRSYKSATNLESPCPICGTMVAMGEKQCTNCGHLM